MLYYQHVVRHKLQVDSVLCWRARIGTTHRIPVLVRVMVTTLGLRLMRTSVVAGRYGVVTPAEPVTLAECQNTQRSGSPTGSLVERRAADFLRYENMVKSMAAFYF